MRNQPRIRRRRKLLLWSAVPALLVLLTAVKLLSVGVLGGNAAVGFDRRDGPAVASAASGLAVANIFEPHKALLAAGDALVLDQDYAGARARFEEALAAAPTADDCPVRLNLVLSIEILGDSALEAGYRPRSKQLYGEALAVIREAPPECRPETRLDDAEERLQEKSERLSQEQPSREQASQDEGESDQTDPSKEAQRSKLEQLEQSGRTAQQERNDGRQRDEYLDGDGAGTDQPW